MRRMHLTLAHLMKMMSKESRLFTIFVSSQYYGGLSFLLHVYGTTDVLHSPGML